MSRVNFIFSTDQQTASLSQLIASYDSSATVDPSSAVRMDKQVAFSVQPVTVSTASDGSVSYAPDFLSTDDYYLSIGNSDQPATSGTFKLTVGAITTNLTALAYNVTGAALTTPLSAAFVANGKPACTATLLTTGVYKVVGNANGAIPTGYVVCDPTNLDPDCDAQVVEKQLGGASTPYILLIVMRQAPLVFARPTTLLPATGVAVATTQAGTTTADQIQTVAFTVTETYAGTFSVGATVPDFDNTKTITAISVANPTHVTAAGHGFTTGDSVSHANTNSTPTIDGTRTVTVLDVDHYTVSVNVTVLGTTGTATELISGQCGIAKPTFTATEFAVMLTNHPLLYFQNTNVAIPDNVSVTKNGTSFVVSFIGTLGRSALPTLSASNIDLVGATGLSGVINYNTVELFEFSLSQDDSFTLPLTIQRRRLDGERRTVFGPVLTTIYKDNLDPMTMIPVTFPTFADLFFASDLSGGPTSDPGGGKPWLNGSVLSVGAP